MNYYNCGCHCTKHIHYKTTVLTRAVHVNNSFFINSVLEQTRWTEDNALILERHNLWAHLQDSQSSLVKCAQSTSPALKSQLQLPLCSSSSAVYSRRNLPQVP